jgi:hypothetical protein
MTRARTVGTRRGHSGGMAYGAVAAAVARRGRGRRRGAAWARARARRRHVYGGSGVECEMRVREKEELTALCTRALPSARDLALGNDFFIFKISFAECQIGDTRQRLVCRVSTR